MRIFHVTNCPLTPISFSPLNRKKVEASFTGGHIGSDGGLLLLRELDKKLQLTKKLSQVIKDNRHAGYVEHSVEQLLKQRIYAIAAGYEDVNDHDQLRHDLCFQTAVCREVSLASSSTMSRFENAVDRQSQLDISKQLVDQFIDQHATPPKEIILDFDPTDNILYGHQEKGHYHGYYREYCYLPLHVFCGDDLLVSLLRSSNIDGSKYAGAILRLLVNRIRTAWPEVKIIFRGDCAFARKHILYWCEQNNVDYIVGIASNKRLQRMAKTLTDQAEKQYQVTGEKQRLFDEFNYAADSWNRSRRIVAKAEYHDKGDNLRFVMTTLKQVPDVIYDDHYCPRGNMENGIKQLKLDFYSDKNSCKNFLANQFRLLLSSIAYVLLTQLRRTHHSLTWMIKAYGQTLRLKLIKIGVVIRKNTRRIQFLLTSHYPYQNDFRQLAQRINSS
jgi:hypothetical protein